MKDIHIFTEGHGNFSWRKMLTALAAVLFCYAVIGFLSFDQKELPLSYQGIIMMIFTYYFARRVVDRIGTKIKEES